MSRIEIALGPLLFNWPVERVAAFYAAVAEAPAIERVYLGEVVCAKRQPLHAEALAEAAHRLARAGKCVVASSLALPASVAERRTLREQIAGEGLVEINDVAALADWPADRPFVAGPLLNVYNEGAAAELAARGCRRLCCNIELSLSSAAAIAAAAPGLEIELIAFGRAQLALSARCYHARLHGRRKDTCQFVCDQDPDGRSVATLEGESFLAINGVQVLSHAIHLAAPEPSALRQAGVCALRLSPHTGDMVAVAGAFRDFLDERIGRSALMAAVGAAAPLAPFVDGYVRGGPGMAAAAGDAG